MPIDMNKLMTARQRWPKRTDTLPASVQAVFEAWDQCGDQERDEALAQIEGFTKPPGRFLVKQKCRDLTLMRSPLPNSVATVPALTAADVSIFFGNTVTPVSHETESDSESVRSTPLEDRMNSMESSLAKCLDTIAKQNEQLVHQAATLERLFKAQADPKEIQTSTYEVADSVLAKLAQHGRQDVLAQHQTLAQIRTKTDFTRARRYVHNVSPRPRHARLYESIEARTRR